MPISNQPLAILRLAETIAERSKDKTAIVVDVSGIPEVNDRLFFRSIVRFIEERAADTPHSVHPLALHCVTLLAMPDAARKIVAQLNELSDFLNKQHHGALRIFTFDLANEPRRFVAFCAERMERNPLPPADRSLKIQDPAAPSIEELDHFLVVERTLRQAEITRLLRSQDIWRLAPKEKPKRLARELWVSIPAVEALMDMPILSDPWLFGRTTELTDHRLLVHLLHPEELDLQPVHVNLHVATVFSGDYRRIVQTHDANRRKRLIVELPYLEWRNNPELFGRAIEVIRHDGLGLVLDGVRSVDLDTVAREGYNLFDAVKLDGANLELGEDLRDPIERIGADKVVLHHCDSDAALPKAFTFGLRQFQGRGIAALMRDPARASALLGPEAGEIAAQEAGLSRPRGR